MMVDRVEGNITEGGLHGRNRDKATSESVSFFSSLGLVIVSPRLVFAFVLSFWADVILFRSTLLTGMLLVNA